MSEIFYHDNAINSFELTLDLYDENNRTQSKLCKRCFANSSALKITSTGCLHSGKKWPIHTYALQKSFEV